MTNSLPTTAQQSQLEEHSLRGEAHQQHIGKDDKTFSPWQAMPANSGHGYVVRHCSAPIEFWFETEQGAIDEARLLGK